MTVTAIYDPEQWQLVPKVATVEMLFAGGNNRESGKDYEAYRPSECDAIYRDMLAVAPQHESQWQDISTAPKDADTPILGLSKQGSMYVICYDDIFSAPWRVLNHEGFNEGAFTRWTPLPQHPDTIKVPRPEGHDSWSIEIKTSYGGGGGGICPDTGETTQKEIL